MSYAVAEPPTTIAEFEAFTARQPHGVQWELVDGLMKAMTNPTEAHALIVAALFRAMDSAARDQGCRLTTGGLRVQAQAADNTTAVIPDLVMRCGPRVDRNWIDDPVIVVEVLSPSTMDFDRGGKLAFYKSLTSVRDIVLVYQDQVRVEHYARATDGPEGTEAALNGWVMTPSTALSDGLSFAAVSVTAKLSAIYADTALSAAPSSSPALR